MALDGGGGGGGGPLGSGNTFTGTSTSLDYVGDHCYAYNLQASSTDPITLLEFQTGNNYIVGDMQCNGATDMTSIDRGQNTAFQIQLNGTAISQLKTDTETEDKPSTVVNRIVIPPYTEVKVICDSDGASFGKTSAVFVGRVYRDSRT